MFSCKLPDLSHATLVAFTCVRGAMLLISSWGGLGWVGWDSNGTSALVTCYASGLYLCVCSATLLISSWGGVGWGRVGC